MIRQNFVVFDRKLNFKTKLIANLESIENSLNDTSFTSFNCLFENGQEKIIDNNDFVFDGETKFFGMVKSFEFSGNTGSLKCVSGFDIFNGEFVLRKAQTPNEKEQINAIIENYIETNFVLNPFLNLNLNFEYTNLIPNSLQVSLPEKNEVKNFVSWVERYIRQENIFMNVSFNSIDNKIKVDIGVKNIPTEITYLDERNEKILKADVKVKSNITNIIQVINDNNLGEMITYYLKNDGDLITNSADIDILQYSNKKVILLSDYSTDKALEEARKVVENTFSNNIELIVKKDLFDLIELNQNVIFVSKNRLQIKTKLTKKIESKNEYTLIFGDEITKLTDIIKNIQKNKEE